MAPVGDRDPVQARLPPRMRLAIRRTSAAMPSDRSIIAVAPHARATSPSASRAIGRLCASIRLFARLDLLDIVRRRPVTQYPQTCSSRAERACDDERVACGRPGAEHGSVRRRARGRRP